MIIIGLCAIESNWGIGKDNKLPWQTLRGDMRRFHDLTDGNIVVMGRRTFMSLPKKARPLPNRLNVVITNKPAQWREDSRFKDDPLIYFCTKDELIQCFLRDHREIQHSVYIIGGSQIWDEFMPYIHMFYMTRIIGAFECDTYLDRSKVMQAFPYTLQMSPIYNEKGTCYYFETRGNFILAG